MIDATAIVDAGAHIADDVDIGPYSIVGPDVEIGPGTWIGPHVVIRGPTRIGRENRIYQFCSIGEGPQDKKYAGEPTRLEIGDRNTIREYCSINRGTNEDRGLTSVGDDNWIMAYVHIAHDCLVGSDVVMANCATLAGHVEIHDYAVLAGFAMIHQFCRVGSYSFCAMGCGVTRDVPPYVRVATNPARPSGMNTEGLRRRGFDNDQLRRLRQAYRILYRSGLRLEQARARLAEMAREHDEIALLVEFIDASRRSIIR